VKTDCIVGTNFAATQLQEVCVTCTRCVTGETTARPCVVAADAQCVDDTPPTITLHGCTADCKLQAKVDRWQEPGFAASDTKDGSLTAAVKVSPAPTGADIGTFTVSPSSTPPWPT